ncbi:hypothetical protein HP439_05855 [Sphingobacterium shayense]|uniref:hypothetical protein n=1 Tax=Sphingobacterium shayense TaxID=626343 RepID=UPI001558252C|nr:hypothetical protein [Sphingobacterium shayense]NQD70243.1 hypothetical protein [Sphingobacterium shayense]
MKNNEKKVYAAPKIEALIVELEQGIASASTNTPAIDDSFEQGTGGSGWSDDTSGF